MDLRTLLDAAKMPLKTDPSPDVVDLQNGSTARWLGFLLSSGPSGLETRIDEKAWDTLRRNLNACHRTDHSARHASQVILGWIIYLGPCLPHSDVPATYRRIYELANESDLEEIPTEDEVRERWEKAYRNYCEIRSQYIHRDNHPTPTPTAYVMTESPEPEAAAPPAAPKKTNIVPSDEASVCLASRRPANRQEMTSFRPVLLQANSSPGTADLHRRLGIFRARPPPKYVHIELRWRAS